jgi:hypothetical protein
MGIKFRQIYEGIHVINFIVFKKNELILNIELNDLKNYTLRNLIFSINFHLR